MQFISDQINFRSAKVTDFNLVASGTGTGKSFMVATELQKQLPEVQSYEILYVTSRSLIVDQQSRLDEIEKYQPKDLTYVKQWNGEQEYDEQLEGNGIQIMTYDKIIRILQTQNSIGHETLDKIKIIIFDECHTLFSDKFIQDMEMLKLWIRGTLYNGKKIIIGMTATPSIIISGQNTWGVTINRLNEDILINYKAKQLICTDFKSISYLITTQLEGKTLVMCYSYTDCKKLKSEIPNSFIMISKSNKEFTPAMDKVRQYIVDNESLPDTFIDEDGIEKELVTLITTSTLREGVNLRENSGIKNIICCFTDELHITQFMGRCRYNVENLIIADTYINSDNFNNNPYLANCRWKFKEFIKNETNVAWFDSISHLIQHDVYKTRRFILSTDEKRFVNYINGKWLVPKGIKDLTKYKIYKEDDKQEIVQQAIKCRLIPLYIYQITFNKVINTMQNTLGYTIESNRGIIENKKYTYKLIVDFEEEKAIYLTE